MRRWKTILSLEALLAVCLWLAVFSLPDGKLHIIACDVGQGDSFLITHKGTQVLIDGGPGQAVLTCLGENMPFWDKTIELVFLTHPQLDHFGGLISVFDRYNVSTFVSSGLDSSSEEFKALKTRVGSQGVKVLNPSSTKDIRLGKIYLDIVSESDSVQNGVLGAYTSKEDPNEYSIVTLVSFGEFDALFTGDIGPEDIRRLLSGGEIRDIELLKVPHHGSKNGLTEELLVATSPEVSLISAGAKNRYGHPHREIIDLLSSKGVKTFETNKTGQIEVISDGQTWQVEP